MTLSRALQALQRSRPGFLLAGLLVLLLGMRLYVGVRCLVEIPQADDGVMITWLQKWSTGVHDWSFIWRFHNNVHPLDIYYLCNLGQYLLNGFWDGRTDFLVSVLVHVLYAAVVFWTFADVLTRRDRWWIYLFTFVLFAVPFAGYRIGWGLVWPNCAPIVFALPAIYLVAHRGQDWASVALICLLAGLAALNTGGGSLAAFLIAGLTLFNAVLRRRLTRWDVTVAAVGVAIFLSVYLNMVPDKRPGALESLGALLKALSWPAVFVPGAGLLTLGALGALVAAQCFGPRLRGANVTFVTGVYGLTVLIAIATGAFRGDNNNMGMPSGRYVDLFLILPLVTAVTLCLLYRASVGRWRIVCALGGCAWLACQMIGFSIQTVYRVVPFLAQETGEWNEAQKQVLFRDIVRGRAPVPDFDVGDDETLGFPHELVLSLAAHEPPPAMTTAMVAGFDLQPGSEGNYTINAFHPSYQGRPARLYFGSFDRQDRAAADRWFVSGPFRPQAPYLTLDVLVDKKARFTNYHLDGLQLTLRDETDGSRVELLPRLARTFPFVLRDWEMTYARVTPGHEYRIESRDRSPTGWLAFSEPLESGRLTPVVVGICQSGKMLCLCGLGLLALVLYLRWLENGSEAPAPTVT